MTTAVLTHRLSSKATSFADAALPATARLWYAAQALQELGAPSQRRSSK